MSVQSGSREIVVAAGGTLDGTTMLTDVDIYDVASGAW